LKIYKASAEKFSGGEESNWKNIEKSQKKAIPKNSTIKPLSGREGATEKRPKNRKNTKK